MASGRRRGRADEALPAWCVAAAEILLLCVPKLLWRHDGGVVNACPCTAKYNHHAAAGAKYCLVLELFRFMLLVYH